MKQKKIVIWDIESSNLSADFATILCVGWKYLGDKKVNIVKISDSPTFKKDPTNDKWVVKQISTILSDADQWVTHYGTRFDVPMVNTKLLSWGLPPLPPVPHVDTWRVSKYKLKLHSNRLASVSAMFGLDDKTPVLGRQWIQAIAGHKPSLNYVYEHCKQDIIVLEEVYNKIKCLITDHPNINLCDDSVDVPRCPICGSDHIHKRGFHIARTSKRQRYQCQRCGGWSSGKSISSKIEIR